jgi:hypothetical protein
MKEKQNKTRGKCIRMPTINTTHTNWNEKHVIIDFLNVNLN